MNNKNKIILISIIVVIALAGIVLFSTLSNKEINIKTYKILIFYNILYSITFIIIDKIFVKFNIYSTIKINNLIWFKSFFPSNKF